MKLDKGYYNSPRWTFEVLDCAMPMTFDTYSNCAHNCLYCFSFFQRAVGAGADDYIHHNVRAVNVERIKRMFTDPDKYAGQFKNYIKRRMTLQWGGLSDGFDWYERKFGVSLELLRFFQSIDYPLSISTKGTWWLDDPRYVELVRGAKNLHWKYSIITWNEDHVKAIEPGVPTTRARFAAMRKLNDLGVGATTLRFRPFILGTSDKYIEEMFKAAADSGCISVTTEFLGWESRSSNNARERLEKLGAVVGYDVFEFYRQNSAKVSGLMRLNYDLKRPYMLQMQETAERYGLKFFVSDAHHKEMSYHAGCCGLPDTGPLSNVNRGQYAHAIKIAKAKGFVRWSDISEEAKALFADVPLDIAEGFKVWTEEEAKTKYQTLYDYMHNIWNNPKSWQSPARYFGGALVPSNIDDDGDIIYIYNKPFIEESDRSSTVHDLAIKLNMVGSPNAQRYDDMTKDGSDGGHVAYPVVVFSKGRAETATTMGLLDKAKINYFLAVPESEQDGYETRLPNADIVPVPVGISKARKYITAMFREQGHSFIWMLDDDIRAVRDVQNADLGAPRSLRAPMSSLENLVTKYSNVSIAGICPDVEVFSQTKAMTKNAPFLKSIYLVNLRTGKDFRDDVELSEILLFQLEHESDTKFVSVRDNTFCFEEAGNLAGGCSLSYLQGFQRVSLEIIKLEYEKHMKFTPAPAPFGISARVIPDELYNGLQSVEVEKLIERLEAESDNG